MKIFKVGLILGLATVASVGCSNRTTTQEKIQTTQEKIETQPAAAAVNSGTIRFASFNVSFNRKTEGQLKQDLAEGDAIDVRRIAEIIQRVRPDVVLLNEFDYDAEGAGIAAFAKNFLAVGQNGQKPIEFEQIYFQTVNTGVDSGLDLNGDGKTGTPSDAFGFGVFPGQYGMVVLSRFEIDRENVRTFQNFLWKDMPDFLWPMKPGSDEPYYNDEIKDVFRLSSKSHWDVPIKVGTQTIHLLCAHPTPPVFDQEEDRNGRRNHDEIRLFADYITPGNGAYLYDDQGKTGGLAEGSHFVIVGDMNADPSDGDSSMDAAKQLTEHSLINHSQTPRSDGGAFYAKEQGRANEQQTGDAAFDTGDFSDYKVGNLHLDYCLPSKTLTIKNSGVFWPMPGEAGADLVVASDHRMVWIDVAQ